MLLQHVTERCWFVVRAFFLYQASRTAASGSSNESVGTLLEGGSYYEISVSSHPNPTRFLLYPASHSFELRCVAD